MRAKIGIVGALMAAAVVGMVLGGVIPAASQSSPNEKLTLCEKDSKGFEKEIDADGDGDFSPGDYTTFVNPLFDAKSGRRHGRDVGTFTFLKSTGGNGWFKGNVTAIFGNGRISVDATGKFSGFRSGVSFPITGGTGHYRNASGIVVAEGGRCDGKSGTRITFDIDVR